MKYIEVYHTDLLNGTGLREVLFLSGCEHHCPGCFNEFTWDPDNSQAKVFDDDIFENLIRDLREPYCSGLTLSGGDPLSHWNVDGVFELVKKVKEYIPNKTIWCYTGYIYENIKDKEPYKSVLKYIDVLCDGPFIQEKKSPNKPWVGSENQRVIDVKKSFASNSVVLYE